MTDNASTQHMDDKQILHRSKAERKENQPWRALPTPGHMGEKVRLRGVLCEMIQMVYYSQSKEIKPTLVQSIRVRMEHAACPTSNMRQKRMGNAPKRSGRVQKKVKLCVTHRRKGNMISTVVVTESKGATAVSGNASVTG